MKTHLPFIPAASPPAAFNAGYDCGKNGASCTNCDPSFFAKAELTMEWERGKRKAEQELPRNAPNPPAP